MLHPRCVFIAGQRPSEIRNRARAREQLGGEIISVDSMQVYRGLDIARQAVAADRARVRIT